MSLRSLVLAGALLLAAAAAQAQPPDAIADLSAHAAHATRAARGQHIGQAGLSRIETVRDVLRASHDSATLRDLVQTREHASFGVVHTEFGQQVAGLDVYGTYVKASFNSSGELTTVIENLVSTAPALRPALVGPEAALQAVLARDYPELAAVPGEVASEGNVVTYALVAPFYRSPQVTRIAVPLRGGALDTGYLVETWDRKNVLRYTVVSGRGQILREELRTNYDAYRVFTINPDVTPQALILNPADPTASPDGWLGSSTTTIGNNVDAYLDRDANDIPDAGSRPTASGQQQFNFVWNGTVDQTTATNQAAAVTNLFYLTNLIHDRLYKYGFDEAAGNFQTDNFGKGGIGNDPLNAEGQDGSGVDNANFATPLDGQRPRMQMYLWDTATPNRDGDVDSDIVFHEYTHGLTWRMVGDMGGVTGGAVGEGMSDAIAIYFNNNDRVAEYSSNNPIGIRTAPYTNYGRTYGYVVGLLGPHLDGEIYAATLWRLRQLWLGRGWSQDTLLRYLVDGLTYTPQRPAYEDMRDGILSSIANMSTELDPHDASCTVWNAFAQYGIGVGADGYEVDVLGLTLFKAIESFAVPADCPAGPPPNQTPIVSITQPITGTTVTQGASVTFTGTATDNEDGNLTAGLSWSSNLDGAIGSGGTFSTTALSVGTHVVTASVTDSGGLTGSAGIVVIVNGTSNTPPSVSITAPANGSSFVQGTSAGFAGSASDTEDGNISANLIWSSNIQPGGVIGGGASFSTSALVVGTHTITATVTDSGGLQGSASITVTITAPNTAPSVAIGLPANGTTVSVGTPISFSGSASDTQDGNLSASISWSSSIDHFLHVGASFTYANLSVGTHTITASVTDSGGLIGSASITVTVTPPSVNIVLSASGYKQKGLQFASLTWTGATTNVDVKRNGTTIATVPNSGAYTDTIGGKGKGTYSYQVCNTGTSTCSNIATVSF